MKFTTDDTVYLYRPGQIDWYSSDNIIKEGKIIRLDRINKGYIVEIQGVQFLLDCNMVYGTRESVLRGHIERLVREC